MLTKKGIIQGLLAAVLFSGMVCIPAEAEAIEGVRGGPGAESNELDTTPGSIVPEYLNDQYLEYSEIQEMIHYFNPTMQDSNVSKEENRSDYTDARAVLLNEAENAKRQKQNAKDEGDTDAYADYASQETTLRSAAKSYTTLLSQLDAYSSNKSSYQTERELTAGAQSLMISLSSLKNQKAASEKMLELYQQLADSTNSRYNAGMATKLEVLEAENQILTARSSLLDLENNIQTIYESLCLMFGQSSSGEFQIGTASLSDLEEKERNLTEDIDTAIGNNYTLIQYRTSLDTNTTSATEYKFRTIAEGEETLTLQIKRLYQEMEQAREALEVAQLGYEQAVLQKQNADASYSVGVISKDEYLNQELSCLQKENTRKSAELQYLQAVSTYDWAITGIADIE